MALLTRLTNSSASATPGSPKALQRFQNCIAFLWPSLQPSPSSRTTTATIDAIDSFTNELVSRNSKKWEDMRDHLMKGADVGATTTSFNQAVGLITKNIIGDLEAVRTPDLGLDIRTLSRPQLENLLLSTLGIKNKVDFLYLIKQCIAWEKLPSDEVLVTCLKYLSSLGSLQYIESFIKICEQQENPLLTVYSGLAPFKAMAQWRGGNADAALSTLSEAYEGSPADSEDGRRMLRAAFRTITEETLSTKSDAVLVALQEAARGIFAKHKDIFVLACIWKQCFLSEWFCDRQLGAQLFDEYDELQSLVGRRSSFLCSSFLRQNNVDAVHRLIEAFLQYKQRKACSICLAVLFDYQCHRRDLRACAEIIKSCSELEMPLSEFQNEQFLSLFLNQSDSKPLQPPNSSRKAQKFSPQFEYKF